MKSCLSHSGLLLQICSWFLILGSHVLLRLCHSPPAGFQPLSELLTLTLADRHYSTSETTT